MSFWKALTETSDVYEVVSAIGQATEWQTMASGKTMPSDVLRPLEKAIEAELGPRWVRIRQQFQRAVGGLDARWHSLILLYAHLLRLPIRDPALQKRASSPKLIQCDNIKLLFHRPGARSPTNPKPPQRPSHHHNCPQLVTADYRSYASARVLGARHSTRFTRCTVGAVAGSQEG
jgi:hypothetical protein